MHSAAFGVIDDARGRQRRRLSIAVMAICAGLALGLIVNRSANTGTIHTPALPAPKRVGAAAVFSQAPDMGVACHSGSCDSVGLAVWLRGPAMSVDATIAGHRFDLTTWQAQPFTPSTPRRMFVGYLTPLRLITHTRLVYGPPADWPTATSPHPLVSVRITYRGGRVVMTRLHVPLQPGWG